MLIACLTALFSFGVASAQTQSEALHDFDFVIDVISRDYSGFPSKTVGAKAAEFQALVRAQRTALELSPSDEAAIISNLLAWFQDRHLSFTAVTTEATPPSGDDARLAAQGPFVAIEGASTKHPLAGTSWVSIDGMYRAVIVADPADTKRALGVITESKSPAWSRGQIKFALAPADSGWDGTYYMRDHRAQQAPATFLGQGSVLRFSTLSIDWVRVTPAPLVAVENIIPSPDFFLKSLSDKTAILRLPNFYGENRPLIEKLLEQNQALLKRIPNLIVDARNNNGGSDSAYGKLMEWIYTRPIYSIGAEFRASARNAELYSDMLKGGTLPPEAGALVGRIVADMRAGDKTWVQAGDRPFSITTYPTIKPNPKRVGILITGAGSSGDQFVLDARQSRKVTTFGGPTAGVIDYSNAVEAPTPSGRFRLQWSTSRSMRLPDEPIDNVGISPDVPIGDAIDDPVRFVQNWLERQVD